MKRPGKPMPTRAADVRARHRSAERRGRRAEWWAGCWMRLKGYQIVAHDLRTPAGQIDLVVRRGRTLAIVEVKRREDRRSALEAVTPHQRARLVAAAAAYLARRPELAVFWVRFDVITITPGRLPHHMADAWRPGD